MRVETEQMVGLIQSQRNLSTPPASAGTIETGMKQNSYQVTIHE